MKTNEKRSRAATAAVKSKETIKPVTVTISGDLAKTIRDAARRVGTRASTFGEWCVRSGELCTSNTEEAKEFRIQMGMSELKEQGFRMIQTQ